ncbi:MAG TPA: tetratricopeptide repeat protein [Acetobacteraceae bacterium]|nr:tetratricopeptide repeat protein [Acetobacteraceae bacterium]
MSSSPIRAVLPILVLLSACAATDPPDNAAAAYVMPNAYGDFLAARYAQQTQDSAAAAQYYAAALALAPHDQKLAEQAFISAILADPSSALPLAREVKQNPMAAMLLGNRDILNGNFTAASTQFASLPDSGLTGLLRPLLLAWTEAGDGKTASAIARLTPLSNNAPFGPVYTLSAALIADIGGDQSQAASLYDAAAKSYTEPNLRLAQILASWQARQGNQTAANATLQQMTDAHPALQIALPDLVAHAADKIVANANQGLAETYLALAGSLNAPDQILLRQTLLRFALQLRPDLTAARLLLADIDVQANQSDAALDILAAVKPTDPLIQPVRIRKATLLAAMGKSSQAILLLNDVLATDPGDIDVLELKGDIYRGAGNFPAAIAAYSTAIGKLPQPAPQAAWTLYYARGISEDQNGGWALAQPDLQAARALDPTQPYVLNYLGYSLAIHGDDLTQAKQMIEQAVGEAPEEGAIIDSLGYIQLRQGKIKQALTTLTRAVQLQPDDVTVNMHLGDAFYANGQKLQARYQWQRALNLKPDAKDESMLEEKLKKVADTESHS